MYALVVTSVATTLRLAFPAAAVAAQAEIPEATRAQVVEAIESYVKEDARVKGAFLLLDPRTGEPIRLDFDHVHEGVKPHEDGYVACVDFKDASGKLYDVDVVVEKGPRPSEIGKVFLHKVAGQEVTEK